MVDNKLENKTSQAQLEATRRWEDRNRLHTRKKNYQRTARLFARTYADKKDMVELNKIFNEENPNASEGENQKEDIQDEE